MPALRPVRDHMARLIARSSVRKPLAPTIDEASAERWAGWMLVFMRVVAGLELLKAVVHWCQLLGIDGGEAGFEGQTTFRQAVVIYFAVLDPVASVGLWMGAPWGAVIWLFAAASQITVLFLMPSFPPVGWLLLPYELLTIGTYILLAYRGNMLKQPSC